MTERRKYIPCGTCAHYFVTYDPARPRGCRKFGFKSTQPPSFEVFAATGMNCAQYQSKTAQNSKAVALRPGEKDEL